MDTQDKESCYPMDTNPIGHCLIINNVEFTGGNLAERVGSDQDATELEELFGNFLNFTVELKRNVTKEQLESTLRRYQQKDHSKFCTFFVILLSHGDEGNIVYASDGQAMNLDDICKYFSTSNCPSLGGKPKVFIVQACRGNQHNTVVSPNRQDTVVHDGGPSTSSQSKIPDEADTLHAYATINHHTALRDTREGSWFIQELVYVIKNYGFNKHLQDLLTIVNNRVQYCHQSNNEVQVTQVSSSFGKFLYFTPHSQPVPAARNASIAPQIVECMVATPPKPPKNITRCHSSPAMPHRENSQSPHLLFKTKTTPAAVSTSNATLGSSLAVTSSSRQIPLSQDLTPAVLARDLTPAEYLTLSAEEQSPNFLLVPRKHSPDSDASSRKSVKGTYHVSEDPKIPQGYCIIINNNTQKYDDQTIKEMREVLSNRLGFHVQVYSSLTRKGMKHLLKTVATVDHSDQYCFVVIVLSKGEREKAVYGSDGKKLRVNKLVMLFSHIACPSLAEKPKLFFTETQLNENDAQPLELSDVPYTFIASYFGSFPVERKPMLEVITSLSIKFSIQESLAAFDNGDPTFTVKDCFENPLHFWNLTLTDTDKEQRYDAELKLSFNVLCKLRKATVEKLENDRQKIFSICQNVRRSRIAGSVTSLVGGGLAVIGLGLIPVTFGGSIALSVIGAGVGVAGGAVSIASTVTDKLISKNKLKKARAVIDIDKQLTEQVNEIFMERYASIAIKEEAVAFILQSRQLLRTGAIAATSGVQVAARSAFHGGVFTLRVTGAAARGVVIAGGVATVLTVPLDLGELIYNSVKLYNKSETKAMKWFDEQLEMLRATLEKLQTQNNYCEANDILLMEQAVLEEGEV